MDGRRAFVENIANARIAMFFYRKVFCVLMETLQYVSCAV